MSAIGQALKRKEDPRMITGQGRYTEDIQVPGSLHAVIVRSPEAHAAITSIDTSAAKERAGVVAVLTGEEMAGDFAGPMAMVWAPPGVEMNTPPYWPLARGQVKHVGDPVAVVVAVSKGAALDAADEVIVDYDPKPVVVDPEAALEDGSPLVWESFGTNKTHEWAVSGGDFDAAAAEAEVTVEHRFTNHRISGAPIEPRCSIAEPRGDSFTLYSTTQIPHIARFVLSGAVGVPEDKLRVVAPDVGGGFGAKLQVYPEEALVLALAKRLGRPVKWTETRSEHMTTSHHGRDQVNYVTLTAKRDGTVTGCRARIIADLGAYQLLLTPFIPTLGFPVMGGCYKFPAIDLHFTGVFTNKMCTDAIRGAGRPEATYWIELMMDRLADELGMDRLELRRKNFIPKDEFPYETALGIVYDSGDYHGIARQAAVELRSRCVPARAGEPALRGGAPWCGLLDLGRGLRACALAGGRAPGRRAAGGVLRVGERPRDADGLGDRLQRRLAARPGPRYELRADRRRPAGARSGERDRPPRRHRPGRVGLGHVWLALALGRGRGDRAGGPQGPGQGQAHLRRAAGGRAGGHRAGRRQVPGARLARQVDDAGRDLRCGAHPAQRAAGRLRAGARGELLLRPGELRLPLRRARLRRGRGRETGKVKVVDYYSVDDCGPAINPMLIEGQVHGGIVHAIGQALYEQVVYDDDGQLVTGTFVDYALPTAAEIPYLHTDRTETPSPTNSLGVKGVGEAGTIAATPAVAAAVLDALAPLGVTQLDMPFTPLRVFEAIQAAKNGGNGGPARTEQGKDLPETGDGSAGSGPHGPDDATGGAS